MKNRRSESCPRLRSSCGKAAGTSNADTAPAQLPLQPQPAPPRPCTLQDLGPEDKQKVAKLLKQVVDLGQEVAQVKATRDELARAAAQREDELQAANQQLAKDNHTLKKKLGQVLLVLRASQAKLNAFEAAQSAKDALRGGMQHTAVQTDGVHTDTDAGTGTVEALGPAAGRDSGQQHAVRPMEANTAGALGAWPGAAGEEGQEGRRARDSWDGSAAGALVLAPVRAASPGPVGQPLLHIAPGSHVSITIHHTLDPGSAGVPALGAPGLAALPAPPAAFDGAEVAAETGPDAAAAGEHGSQQPGFAPTGVCADHHALDRPSCLSCAASGTTTETLPALPTHSSTRSHSSTSCLSSMGQTHNHHHHAPARHLPTAMRSSTASVASSLQGAAPQREQPLPPPLPRHITVDPQAAALRFPEVPVQEVHLASHDAAVASPLIVAPSAEVVAAASSLLHWQAAQGLMRPGREAPAARQATFPSSSYSSTDPGRTAEAGQVHEAPRDLAGSSRTVQSSATEAEGAPGQAAGGRVGSEGGALRTGWHHSRLEAGLAGGRGGPHLGGKVLSFDPAIGPNGAFYFVDMDVTPEPGQGMDAGERDGSLGQRQGELLHRNREAMEAMDEAGARQGSHNGDAADSRSAQHDGSRPHRSAAGASDPQPPSPSRQATPAAPTPTFNSLSVNPSTPPTGISTAYHRPPPAPHATLTPPSAPQLTPTGPPGRGTSPGPGPSSSGSHPGGPYRSRPTASGLPSGLQPLRPMGQDATLRPMGQDTPGSVSLSRMAVVLDEMARRQRWDRAPPGAMPTPGGWPGRGGCGRPGLDASPSSWHDGGYGGGYGDAVSVCDSSWAGSDVTERYDDTLVDILSQADQEFEAQLHRHRHTRRKQHQHPHRQQQHQQQHLRQDQRPDPHQTGNATQQHQQQQQPPPQQPLRAHLDHAKQPQRHQAPGPGRPHVASSGSHSSHSGARASVAAGLAALAAAMGGAGVGSGSGRGSGLAAAQAAGVGGGGSLGRAEGQHSAPRRVEEQAPSMEALLSTNLYEENDVLSAILEQEGWL